MLTHIINRIARLFGLRQKSPLVPRDILALALGLQADWPERLAALRASGTPLASYDNVISRTDAGSLMPEDVSDAMLNNLQTQAKGSAVLKSFTHVPVSRGQTRFPILSALPIAYWVNGDAGVKQTTEVNWANKYMNIEEIAVIVPVPDNVLDDSDTPIWDQVQPLCEEAAARLLDATVMFGVNAPSSFPPNVAAAAIAAGNSAVAGTAPQNKGGIIGDHSDMLAKLEADGYDAVAGVANRTVRGLARQARNVNGDRFGEITLGKDMLDLDGVEYTFPMRGSWPTGPSKAQLIAMDTSEFVVGVRKDISWKLLDQAVITDNAVPPNIIYNLPQQDMVAMRMTMRVGWQVANTINYDQTVEANRYPAGVLLTPAS